MPSPSTTPPPGQLRIYLTPIANTHAYRVMLAGAEVLAELEGKQVILACLPETRPDVFAEELEHYKRGAKNIALTTKLDDEKYLSQLLNLPPSILVVSDHTLLNSEKGQNKARYMAMQRLKEAGHHLVTLLPVYQIASVSSQLKPALVLDEEAFVPESVLKNADEIEAIDLSPRDAIRLIGKHRAYLPKPIIRQFRTFLNQSNIQVLRENQMMFTSNQIMNDVAALADHYEPEKSWQEKVISYGRQLFKRLALSALVLTGVMLFVEGLDFVLGEKISLLEVGFLFLGGVVFSALTQGLVAGLAMALLAFITYNSVYVPSIYGFEFQHIDNYIGPAIFLVIALMTGIGVGKKHDELVRTRQERRRREALYQLIRETAQEDDPAKIVAAIQDVLLVSFGLHGAVWVNTFDSEGLQRYPEHRELSDLERDALKMLKEIQQPVLPHPPKFKQLPYAFYPLMSGQELIGVLELEWTPKLRRTQLSPAFQRFWLPFLDQSSLALNRSSLRQEASEALVQSERESLRSALLSSISHDLKTPLVSIVGAMSSLRLLGKHLDVEDQMELVATAEQEARRLNKFITNILEMTKLEAGGLLPKRDWVPLIEVIAHARDRVFRQLGKTQIELHIPDDFPEVFVEPTLLSQVFFNLFENAIKYAPNSELIAVAAGVDQQGAYIDIADRGPGIPEAEKEKVFDKFYRAQQRDSKTGTGLGLAICRGIIEAHGGTLEARDRTDGETGTVMRLRLKPEHIKG